MKARHFFFLFVVWFNLLSVGWVFLTIPEEVSRSSYFKFLVFFAFVYTPPLLLAARIEIKKEQRKILAYSAVQSCILFVLWFNLLCIGWALFAMPDGFIRFKFLVFFALIYMPPLLVALRIDINKESVY